jgi:predicted transcriptional regulator
MQFPRTSFEIQSFMDKSFPILDSGVSIKDCIKRLSRHEACIVTNQGYFYGVLGVDDILKGLIKGGLDKKIKDIEITNNYSIVGSDSDIFDIAELMREEDIEFVVVKEKDRFLGIVTKKEMASLESRLFDMIGEIY